MATQIGTGTGTTLATFIPDLADTANVQTALKQLYYGTTNATLSQTTGIYGALYTLYTGNPTLAGNVTISGTLTVNGGTTTINSTTITIDDKLVELGAVASPTNTTADGGGISLFGTTNKTILWDNTNANWTTSENWNLATGKTLKINNVDIASGTGAALVLGANASTSLALGNTSGTTTLNGTLSVNNPNKTMAHLMGYTSTVTSATPVVLTNTSSYYQQFTGSTAQTVTLPVTSTLAQGWTFHIVNNSSANITVNASSAVALVITVIPGTTAMVTCISTSTSDNTAWEAGLTDFSTYTGSGNLVLATSPTITTPVISSITNTGTITIPTTTGTLALTSQTFYIGTQAITINQGTGTITSLPGVTSINGATLPSSGTIITSSSPTITTPTIDTVNTSLTTSGTALLWNTGITTGTISIGGALTSGTVNIAASATGTKTINIGTSTGTNTIAGGTKFNGLVSTNAAAPTIASAATIAPTTQIVFVSGTTQIATITAPAPISTTGGQITIIPTGVFTTTVTGGNIALASTAVVSKALIMTYDTTTAKWYPSY